MPNITSKWPSLNWLHQPQTSLRPELRRDNERCFPVGRCPATSHRNVSHLSRGKAKLANGQFGIKSTNGFHKPPSFAHVLKDSNVHRFSSPDFTSATCNMVQPCKIANPSEVPHGQCRAAWDRGHQQRIKPGSKLQSLISHLTKWRHKVL